MSATLRFSLIVATMTFGSNVQAQAPGDESGPLVEKIELASSQWMASCKGAKSETCSVVRGVQRKNACQTSVLELEQVARRSIQGRKAREALQSSLASTSTARINSSPAIAGAVAQARFFLAEQAFEALANVQSPRGLNFSDANPKIKKQSGHRFLKFFQRVQSETEAVVSGYQTVVEMENSAATERWRTASLARIARTYALFAEQLYGMEIPKDVRTGPHASDAIAAFCDALEVPAQALEGHARAAVEACLAHSGATESSLWGAECSAVGATLVPIEPPK